MARYITRDDIEAAKGPAWLRKRLEEAVDPTSSPAEQQAQREARLAAALDAGDALIHRYLGEQPTDPVPGPIFDHARDEAIYHLQKHSESGAPSSALVDAQLRIESLSRMRGGDEWTPEPQSNQSIGVVPNTGPFSRSSLKGFT